MMDDAAFLATIRAAPADDTPRLVYADWLEERAGTVVCVAVGPHHGDRCDGGRVQSPNAWFTQDCPTCSGTGSAPNGYAEWAEFIRVQCELARLAAGDDPHTGSGNLSGWYCDNPACRACVLRKREYELWREHGSTFAAGLPGEDAAILPGCVVSAGIGPPLRYTFRRGFVIAVECAAADWIEHAESLTLAHPVERVRLTEWAGMAIDGTPMGPEEEERFIRSMWPGIAFDFPAAQQRGNG